MNLSPTHLHTIRRCSHSANERKKKRKEKKREEKESREKQREEERNREKEMRGNNRTMQAQKNCNHPKTIAVLTIKTLI